MEDDYELPPLSERDAPPHYHRTRCGDRDGDVDPSYYHDRPDPAERAHVRELIRRVAKDPKPLKGVAYIDSANLHLLAENLAFGRDEETAAIMAGLWPSAVAYIRRAALAGNPRAEYQWKVISQAQAYYLAQVADDANKAAHGWPEREVTRRQRTYMKGGEEVTEAEETVRTGYRFSPEAALKRAERILPKRWANQMERHIAVMTEDELDAFILETPAPQDALPPAAEEPEPAP